MPADDAHEVVVGSGSLVPDEPTGWFPHRWTDGGVAVVAPFTGAHLLHLAVAGCVLNDVHREAAGLGLALGGVRVEARGGFDAAWASTGITYAVEVAGPPAEEVERLLATVDAVAEIPAAVRAGAPVERVRAT